MLRPGSWRYYVQGLDAEVIRHRGSCSICERVSSMMCVGAAPGAWRFYGICGIRAPLDAARAHDVDAAEDLEPN